MEDFIAEFGYLGLFLLLVGENLFPPIPSEAILPLAGFFVERGELAFVGALAASTAGSVAGALILYAIGHRGGRPLVLRYGRLLRITPADLDRADEWFKRYGDAVVLFARVVPIARSVVSVPAGCLRMPLVRFTILTTVGSAVWNAALISAGWLLGANWERISDSVGTASKVVLVLAVAAACAVGVWWWRRRIAQRPSA